MAAAHDGVLSDDFSDLVAALSAEASTAPAAPHWPVVPTRASLPGAPVPEAPADDGFDFALSPGVKLEQGNIPERSMLDADFRRLFEDLDGPKAEAPTDAAFEVDLSLALESLLAEEPAPTAEERQPDLDRYFQGLRDEATDGATAGDGERLLREGEASFAAGQPERAVEQLRAAARDPIVRLQASRLLGRMARDRGDLEEAIEWFERAAEVPVPELETWQALLYELADTLEVAGEHARALAVLLELRAATPGYRNVDSRVVELSSRQAGPWPTGTRRSA
jgi:tetratricopeptide (TPR) repeat protein